MSCLILFNSLLQLWAVEVNICIWMRILNSQSFIAPLHRFGTERLMSFVRESEENLKRISQYFLRLRVDTALMSLLTSMLPLECVWKLLYCMHFEHYHEDDYERSRLWRCSTSRSIMRWFFHNGNRKLNFVRNHSEEQQQEHSTSGESGTLWEIMGTLCFYEFMFYAQQCVLCKLTLCLLLL